MVMKGVMLLKRFHHRNPPSKSVHSEMNCIIDEVSRKKRPVKSSERFCGDPPLSEKPKKRIKKSGKWNRNDRGHDQSSLIPRLVVMNPMK